MSEFETSKEEYSLEQEEVFQRYREGKNVFITGPGGTGKTRIIKRIYEDALEQGKKIQVCAMTGCAAVLLETKAKTIHSWSGIGLGQGDNELVVMKVMKKTGVSKRWRDVDILIIDEVSMMSKKIFELLNLLAKRSRRKLGQPFGGLQVIFSGDFFQLPPVFRPAVDDPDCGLFCFESPIWNRVFGEESQIPLVKNFRQTDDVYMEILNEIREGRVSDAHAMILKKRVGMSLDPALELTPTQIYPINSKVVDVNTLKLMELPEPGKIFEMEDLDREKLGSEKRDKLLATGKTMEDLHQAFDNLKKGCLCEPKLKLKIGTQVMHIVNRKVDGIYLCNGEQGTIIDFVKIRKLITLNVSEIVKKSAEDAEGAVENIPITPKEESEEEEGGEWEEVPLVKFLNGWTLKVGYHEWMSEELEGVGIRQIPLILAWAVSIHKCQGTTLGIAEVDIGSSVFECAQSYVALSRVKTLGGLYLKSFDPRKIRADPRAVEFYRNLAETRVRVLEERKKLAILGEKDAPPKTPTISRYFQAISSKPAPSIVIERSDKDLAKRGGTTASELEEDNYTEVADYMKTEKETETGTEGEIKVIDFSRYAYRGY